MNRIIILVVVLIIITACSPTPSTVSEFDIQTAIAQTVAAEELDSTATPNLLATDNFFATATNYALETQEEVIKVTASAEKQSTLYADQTQNASRLETQSANATRKALTPTFTPTNTLTPTPLPGIGSTVDCNNHFSITVLEPPVFKKSVSYFFTKKAVGEFLVLKVEILNKTSKTWDDFYIDEFQVLGKLDGNEFTFESDYTSSTMMADVWRVQDFTSDELPPGVPYTTAIGFDVNPDASDWVFVFLPDDQDNVLATLCTVKIPLK